MNEAKLNQVVKSINPLQQDVMALVQQRLDSLTKPPGSLGKLEDIVKQLGGITGNVLPLITQKAVLVMAADHGVVAEGVSAFPQEVTPQMVYNFLAGGAAINVLAKQAGAEVICTDVGVAADLEHPKLRMKKVAKGTANIAKGPAMTREQAIAALLVGIETAQEQIAAGVNLLATGDMGIGNTSPSTAIVAVLMGRPVEEVVGRGTGIDNPGLERKIQVIKQAIAINQPDPEDGLDVLGKVGGLEIAALAGSILGAAAGGVPIVIDGFISTAAALIAATLAPASVNYMLPSHCSQEPGHILALSHLGMEPMLNLSLRLGEGTGAVLAFYLVEAACQIIRDMATFEEAGVANSEQ
ncbi:MAG: nicotinate-nucleotide--dimethylbenzimidazole phosphoribosyltransferase [Peptococcaceae bacterium]|nr:nicotinate-nucleotide--dimethylbenzimidazole phosphoribosyltransferase [Peptococcaceae bacterium]